MAEFILNYQTPQSAMEKMHSMKPEDMEKAKELVKDHPHLEFGDGCYIEIYEKMTPPKC